MEFTLQVGKVAFSGNLPFSYRWKKEDLLFTETKPIAEKNVLVYSIEENLKIPETKPCAQTDTFRVWRQNGEEIRAYNAVFYPGSPVYAVSRRSGDTLQISFNGDTNICLNPNMQIWNLLHLENYLLETDGLILHSCYTMYRDKAILFTAPSGTGKTTQANLWKKCYGSEIINGDKCILQRHEGQWQAWGYPYHGSARECENRNYLIDTIAIVRQDKRDWVEEIKPTQKLGLLYSECTVNRWDQERANTAVNLLTDLIMKVTVVIIHCTMEDSAAHVLYEYLYGGNDGTV